MQRLARLIGRGNQTLGYIVAPLTLVITVLVLYEVLARYLFNRPTTWANEVNQYLLCALVMLAGGYTLRHQAHTRVDILFSRFGDKTRAWVEVLTGVLILIMAVPMFWYGLNLTIDGIVSGETSVSAARIQLWPSKATVPLGALVLGLQAIANAMEAIVFLRTGQKPAAQ